MSAPDTNIRKQKRRHWAPLLGSALVVIFGVSLIAWWVLEESAEAPNTSAPTEATSDIGASGSGGAADTAGTVGEDSNTSGTQPGVEIDGSTGAGTPSTIGTAPPAGN